MCFYERTDFSCGDHKWGNMRQQCDREYRRGETCGARLTHESYKMYDREPCRTCQEIATKKRRYWKERDNYERWSHEPQKFTHSMAKAREEMAQLENQIGSLESRRTSVRRQL